MRRLSTDTHVFSHVPSYSVWCLLTDAFNCFIFHVIQNLPMPQTTNLNFDANVVDVDPFFHQANTSFNFLQMPWLQSSFFVFAEVKMMIK